MEVVCVGVEVWIKGSLKHSTEENQVSEEHKGNVNTWRQCWLVHFPLQETRSKLVLRLQEYIKTNEMSVYVFAEW